MEYDFAPSSIPEKLIIPIIETIFQQKFANMASVSKFLTSTPLMLTPNLAQIPIPIDIVQCASTHKMIVSNSLELKYEEPAGYTPLGYLVVVFAEALTKMIMKGKFYHHQSYHVADNSKPGGNPATDDALIYIMDSYI